MDGDIQSLERLRTHFGGFVERAGDDPRRLFGLAKSAERLGLWTQSRHLLIRARDCAAPESALHREIADWIAGAIPSWHWSMLGDRARNAAFERAIERAVRPGDRVLDIGTGSGLLAMMAARAGAGEVVACEKDPLLADVADQVAASNGLSDRIRVIATSSQELDPDGDMNGRFDVIVGEVLGNNLLHEGMLPTMKDAATRLLRPGGRMVPHMAEIRIALCDWTGFELFDRISGFDLAAFNPLMKATRRLGSDQRDLTVRSDSAALFSFDFADPDMPETRENRVLLEATGGAANGVVQWLRIDLGGADYYENHPLSISASHWRPLFYPFDNAIDTAPGALVAIEGSHDALSVRISPG